MKWKALKYTIPLFLYISIICAFLQRGWIIFIPILISFALLPIAELVIDPDENNFSEAEEAIAAKEKLYDWFLYAVVPFQYAALFIFLNTINQPDLLWWETAGRVLAMGLACGTFGINVGHELGHRKNELEQWLAKLLLLSSLYTQFFIEHNKGHHKNVSTPHDPSSAPLGMSLYRFWIKSIVGVYAGAWHIANKEQHKKGLPALHPGNEMLQLQLLQLLLIVLIGLWFGWVVLLYFFAAALTGILLLETVNYIEHYGLSRKETTAGKFERTMPHHSWNSNHVLGRIVLFELSRHSDHHYLASRKYQILRHHENAPQLPTGYPGCMLISTIPPLWFHIMNRQMKKYQIS